MIKTYDGSCHCGAVQFRCQLDLAESSSRCNCSVCRKGRFWKSIAMAEQFQLVRGQEALTDYTFNSESIHHLFCQDCGIKPFGRGHMEELGGTFYAINVACLDGLSDRELAQIPVHYEDGRHDCWDAVPENASYL